MGEQSTTQAQCCDAEPGQPHTGDCRADLPPQTGIGAQDSEVIITTRLDAIRGKPLPTVKVVQRTRTQVEVEDCRQTNSPYETRMICSIGGSGMLVTLTGDERRRLIAALFRFERDASGEAF
jgi:hypothetical protein